MTPIEELLNNLDMVQRLINELTMQDISTAEGKYIYRILENRERWYSAAIKKYPVEKESLNG